MSDFERCIAFVLEEEGGEVNNPKDPGGHTKYGISKRSYPDLDISALTVDRAKAIYLRDYWKPIKGDRLPSGLNLLALDCAVNQGVGIAARYLQLAANVNVDGVIGDKTIEALRSKEAEVVAVDFCARRALRYAKNPNVDTFGRGWYRRLFRAFSAAFGDKNNG